jgi:hypothetical protein
LLLRGLPLVALVSLFRRAQANLVRAPVFLLFAQFRGRESGASLLFR